jgi:hypothetical protein
LASTPIPPLIEAVWQHFANEVQNAVDGIAGEEPNTDQCAERPMPRYYFNIYNHEVTLDDEGRELPDLGAARELALESARELVCESVHQGHLNLDHRIEVTDESGESVIVLTFREAFTIGN